MERTARKTCPWGRFQPVGRAINEHCDADDEFAIDVRLFAGHEWFVRKLWAANEKADKPVVGRETDTSAAASPV